MRNSYWTFGPACAAAIADLKENGTSIDVGRWQGVPTGGKPDLVTKEILNLKLDVSLERREWSIGPKHKPDPILWAMVISDELEANQPWANEHFAERVGGKPLNPDPSYEHWPWWRGQDEVSMTHMVGTHATHRDKDDVPTRQFTHTYSERFWPSNSDLNRWTHKPIGIRYSFGDYNDVLDLLAEDPFTRQAYLPIFFPEDTGAIHRGRIPCTLGYHFLLRDNTLHCWYEIRSCDAVRHFRDDLYLAARLVGHTITQLQGRSDLWSSVIPGTLFFTAHSFHVHAGDAHLL